MCWLASSTYVSLSEPSFASALRCDTSVLVDDDLHFRSSFVPLVWISEMPCSRRRRCRLCFCSNRSLFVFGRLGLWNLRIEMASLVRNNVLCELLALHAVFDYLIWKVVTQTFDSCSEYGHVFDRFNLVSTWSLLLTEHFSKRLFTGCDQSSAAANSCRSLLNSKDWRYSTLVAIATALVTRVF